MLKKEIIMPVKNEAEMPVEQTPEERIKELESEVDAESKRCSNLESQYRELQEKYNRLFNLFANNIDFYLGNK